MKAAIRAIADRVYCSFLISQINEGPNYLPNNLVVFKEKKILDKTSLHYMNRYLILTYIKNTLIFIKFFLESLFCSYK